jgi:GT2 family glycosyltransferase
MPADPSPLAAEIRRRLGPAPESSPAWPLVSIVVASRDGAGMLRRMLGGLVEHTDYPQLELVVVDNASSDDSIAYLRRAEAPFPISILANSHNESFSDACNQGAELASGDLLLFLNNDTEPFESGWLRELVACHCASRAGAVASTLVCPEREHEASYEHGYGVQHRGLAFREEDCMLHPALHGWEADPLDDLLGQDLPRGAVAAACVLVGREEFERVGGFTHGYVYGAEDIDLCLKLHAAGLEVLCSGRSIAIHHPVSTRRRAPFEEERARKLANRSVLWERWGPRLRRLYESDCLQGGGLWAEAGASAAGDWSAPSFCFKAADPAQAGSLHEVADVLGRRGHRCLLLERDRAEDPTGLNYDVAVHLAGAARYVPKSGQLNVLWQVGPPGAVPAIERGLYDLVMGGAEGPQQLAQALIEAVQRDAAPGRSARTPT